MVNDLRTLRTLGEYLLCFDAVTFLAYLEALRASESVASVWLFHEAAHTIFEQVPPGFLTRPAPPSPHAWMVDPWLEQGRACLKAAAAVK